MPDEEPSCGTQREHAGLLNCSWLQFQAGGTGQGEGRALVRRDMAVSGSASLLHREFNTAGQVFAS